MEVIDAPGFITTRVGNGAEKTFLRTTLLPENLLASIEEKVVRAHGDRGEKALYSAGREFGLAFSELSGIPTMKNSPRGDLEKFVLFLTNLVGSAFAIDAASSIDFGKKRFSLSGGRYVVCTRNGIGKIFIEGGTAGIISHIFQHPMDCVQEKCCGRGDAKCAVECFPTSYGGHAGTPKAKAFPKLEKEKYVRLNAPTKAVYSRTSLKDLIDAGIAKWTGRIVEFEGERLFFSECHLLPLVEMEVVKLRGGKKILFDAGFAYGRQLAAKNGGANGQKNAAKLIGDYFSAAGLGDVLVTPARSGFQVIFNHFPWMECSTASGFPTLCGILSGALTEFTGKRTLLKNPAARVTGGEFSVKIS